MQKYTAIILSSHDIGEFDRIYTFYSREAGIVKAIGRGARKQAAKLAGHLEPGTFSEIYVARSRGMGQITSAVAIENFENIRDKFESLAEVLEIFRFFTKNFSEGGKDEKIFDLLGVYLGILNKGSQISATDIIKEAFWWKLFDFLGYRPETMKCSRCKTKLEQIGANFISPARGGVICKKCFSGGQDTLKISSDQIKLLRIFLANSLEKALRVKASERELDGLRRIRKEFEGYNF